MSNINVPGKTITNPEIKKTLNKLKHLPDVNEALRNGKVDNADEANAIVNPDGSLFVDEKDLKIINDKLTKLGKSKVSALELGTLAQYFSKHFPSVSSKGYAVISLPTGRPKPTTTTTVNTTPADPNPTPPKELKPFVDNYKRLASSNEVGTGLQLKQTGKGKDSTTYSLSYRINGSSKNLSFEIPTEIGKNRKFKGLKVTSGGRILEITYLKDGNPMIVFAYPTKSGKWVSISLEDKTNAKLAGGLYTDNSLTDLIQNIFPNKNPKAATTQVGTGSGTPASGNSAPTDKIAKAIINRLPKGNHVVSSYSVLDALTMLFGGMKKEEYAKVAKKLGLSPDLQAQLKAAAANKNKLKQTPGVTLSVANKAYSTPKSFTDSYKGLIQKYFDPKGPGELNFKKDPNAARKEINKWVSQQTNGLIPELLTSGDVDAKTAFVLVNAIYFKGQWASKFKARRTYDARFTLANGKTKDVPMMHQTAKFPFFKGANYKAVALPYKGGKMSMIVVLPDDGAQLSTSKDFYTSLQNKMTIGPVQLALPKFTVETRTSVNDALTDLGLGSLLNGSADYSKMTKGQINRLKVIIKTVFMVDEAGAKGAAATAVVATRGGFNGNRFNANRPFHFAVIHHDTGTILFQGEIKEPK